jgi:hypothetical protein
MIIADSDRLSYRNGDTNVYEHALMHMPKPTSNALASRPTLGSRPAPSIPAPAPKIPDNNPLASPPKPPNANPFTSP